MAALEASLESALAPQTHRRRRSAIEHYDASPIRKVGLECWKRVLTRIEPALPAGSSDTLDDVVRTLTGPDVAQHLQELLHVLHDLGTSSGAQAIHEAGILLGVDRSDWPAAVEELAVEMWARGSSHRDYERILQFAEIAIHDREADLRCREFTASAPRPLACTPREVAKFSDALRAWFGKEGMGGTVTVKVHAEPDRHVLCVFHGARVQSESTVNDNGQEALLTFRPLMCDVISYERDGGRLRISARTRRIGDAYREAMGTAFFESPDFFTDRTIYTLTPIVEAVRTGSLPEAPFELGMRSVALMSCVWNTSDGIVVRIYGRGGRDCTAQARRANFQPEHDELAQATLAFFFPGARRPERVDVVIRAGNRLDCRKPIHRDAIETYLEHIGVRRPPLQAAPPKPVSQLTGIQSVARWKQALGSDLRAAVDNGVLAHAQRPAVSTAGVDAAGALPLSELLNDGGAAAVEDGSLVIVDPETLAGYELDGRRLGELLRAELRCERSLAALPLAGLYDLGPVNVGAIHVRPFLVTRFVDDPPAIERLLRNQVPAHEKVVSIHLPNTSLDRWTCAISLDRLALPFRARCDVIRVLRLENDVPAVELAGDERLVVDVRTHTAWLDSVILDLTEGERATLEALAVASKRGRSIPAGELSTMVGGSKAGPEVAKQRIRYLRSAIRKSVEKDEPKLVLTPRRGEGYRLGIPVFLVE
jgi:hypothetical protein